MFASLCGLATAHYLSADQAAPAAAGQGLSTATRAQAMAAVTKGAAFLHSKQKTDGSWESHPGVTGLVAAALLRRPGVSRAEELRTTGRALDMLAKLAKPDGGIHADDLETYVTAIGVMALQAGARPEDLPTIRKAREYLVKHMLDEGEGLTPADTFYGGIGYRPPPTKDAARGDIVNLEFGLRALKETDLGPEEEAWKKAIAFLQRLQNNSATNDQKWAANDGGFIYQPGLSKAGTGEGTMSYGSATYSGILGLTYANLKKGDPRVDAAYGWINANYTVDENPGLGQKTVYYLLHGAGQALAPGAIHHR